MINGLAHKGQITLGDIDMWSFQAKAGDWVFLSIGKVSDDNDDDNGEFWPNIQLIGPDGQPVGGGHGLNVAVFNGAVSQNRKLHRTGHQQLGPGGRAV